MNTASYPSTAGYVCGICGQWSNHTGHVCSNQIQWFPASRDTEILEELRKIRQAIERIECK